MVEEMEHKGKLLYDESKSSRMRKRVSKGICLNFAQCSFIYVFAAFSILSGFRFFPIDNELNGILGIFFGIAFLIMIGVSSVLSFTYLKIYENGLIIPKYHGHLGTIYRKIFGKKDQFIEYQEIQAIYRNNRAPRWFINRAQMFVVLKDNKNIAIGKYSVDVNEFLKTIHGKVPLVSNRLRLYNKMEFMPVPDKVIIRPDYFLFDWGKEKLSGKYNEIDVKIHLSKFFMRSMEISFKDERSQAYKIVALNKNPKVDFKLTKQFRKYYKTNR